MKRHALNALNLNFTMKKPVCSNFGNPLATSEPMKVKIRWYPIMLNGRIYSSRMASHAFWRGTKLFEVIDMNHHLVWHTLAY